MKFTMQRLILLFTALLPFFLSAQTEGEITFAETISFGEKLKVNNPELADLFPDSQTSYKQMFFSESACLMQEHPDKGEDQEFSGSSNGAEIHIKIERSQDVLYTDLAEGASTEKKDFMGRTFLIDQDEPTPYEWKILGEQALIAGQLCIKAIHAEGDSSEQAIAWFAPQIPVSAGPRGYNGLPGMILKLELEMGSRTYVAEEVTFREVSEEEMTRPTEGRKVTREEFEQIVEEKTREMEMEYGGQGGGVRIIQRRN